MNTRLELLWTGLTTALSSCSPVLRNYKVSFFGAGHQWTIVKVKAYSTYDAAKRVNPKLRPGYNCFVVKTSR